MTRIQQGRGPLPPHLSLRSHLKGLFPLTGCGYTPLFRASLSKKPSKSFPSPPTSFSTHAYVHSALPFLPLGSSTYRMQSPFLEETRGDLAFFSRPGLRTPPSVHYLLHGSRNPTEIPPAFQAFLPRIPAVIILLLLRADEPPLPPPPPLPTQQVKHC